MPKQDIKYKIFNTTREILKSLDEKKISDVVYHNIKENSVCLNIHFNFNSKKDYTNQLIELMQFLENESAKIFIKLQKQYPIIKDIQIDNWKEYFSCTVSF